MTEIPRQHYSFPQEILGPIQVLSRILRLEFDEREEWTETEELHARESLEQIYELLKKLRADFDFTGLK